MGCNVCIKYLINLKNCHFKYISNRISRLFLTSKFKSAHDRDTRKLDFAMMTQYSKSYALYCTLDKNAMHLIFVPHRTQFKNKYLKLKIVQTMYVFKWFITVDICYFFLVISIIINLNYSCHRVDKSSKLITLCCS